MRDGREIFGGGLGERDLVTHIAAARAALIADQAPLPGSSRREAELGLLLAGAAAERGDLAGCEAELHDARLNAAAALPPGDRALLLIEAAYTQAIALIADALTQLREQHDWFDAREVRS